MSGIYQVTWWSQITARITATLGRPGPVVAPPPL